MRGTKLGSASNILERQQYNFDGCFSMLAINTNVSAMGVVGELARSGRGLSKTMGHISSGQRIDRAADDAAGLAVSENLDSKFRSQTQAQRNITDGMSMIQTVEEAYDTTMDLFKRIRELAVQASSESYSDEDRAFMDTEYDELVREWGRIQKKTEFNGQKLLTPDAGDTAATITVQAGTDNSANDQVDIRFESTHLFSMVISWAGHYGHAYSDEADLTKLGLDSVENARGTIDNADAWMKYTNRARTQLGATYNRLEHAMDNLTTNNENTAIARSRIRDADMAFETAEMARGQVMNQAATSVLGQANGLNQSVLRLI